MSIDRTKQFRLGSTCCALAFLLFVGPAAMAQQPPAQIAVSPPRIEIEIGNKPVREHFRLMNLGEKPVQVEVSISNWELDDQNQLRTLPPNEQSLDQWMITNPTRFTVLPNESQVVRFAVRPRIRPAPGEHRAIVYFTQQPSEETTDSQIQVLFQLGAAVYAYVGDVTHRGKLRQLTRDGDTNPPRFLFDIESLGDAHVRLNGQFVVWPEASYPGKPGTKVIQGLEKPGFQPPKPLVAAGNLPTTPVLPGTRRKIPLSTGLALEPGRYVLDIKGVLGETPIDRGIPLSISTQR